MRSDPEDYKRMTQKGDWELDDFELSDVQVIFPVEDTAIIAYKVPQTGTMKAQPMDLNCADSSTWVREDGVPWLETPGHLRTGETMTIAASRVPRLWMSTRDSTQSPILAVPA